MKGKTISASGPGDAPRPTPRGERPCVPKARLAGGIQSAARRRHDAQAEQTQSFRQASGAPSGTRRGGPQADPCSQDTRAARTMKRNKKRAEALDAYTSPLSAIDSTESPATIR